MKRTKYLALKQRNFYSRCVIRVQIFLLHFPLLIIIIIIVIYHHHRRRRLLSQPFSSWYFSWTWSPPLRLQVSHCSIFRIMCDVFCSESIEYFPVISSKFFLKLLVTIPLAPVITGIIVRFKFHIRCTTIPKFLHFNILLYCATLFQGPFYSLRRVNLGRQEDVLIFGKEDKCVLYLFTVD